MPTPRQLAVVAGAVGVVGGLTAAVSLGALPLAWLAGTPEDVEHGRVWLLLTSALVADHPIGASLAAFAGFAIAVTAVCGGRVAFVTAVAGHVGSTVVVYLAVFAVRAVDVHALAAAAHDRDYGVSAIFAAWLGSLAFAEWRRRPEHRAGVVLFVVLCSVVGWFADTDRTPLDVEHVVAFALGILVARSVRDAHEIKAPRRRGRPRLLARSSLEQVRELSGRLLDHRADERANHVT